MGNCENCKHWAAFRVAHDVGAGNEGQYRPCSLTRSERGYATKTSGAVAFDAEPYVAQLWTRADFGCVQFEARTRGGTK